MKKVLVVTCTMGSHLYASAKLARLLSRQEGYEVHYGCPDHAPSIKLTKSLLPKEVRYVNVGSISTTKQINERKVTDPLTWKTLWKALKNPLPLADGANDMFDEQEGMYEPIRHLIRNGNYNCVITMHSSSATVCDAVESLKAEGLNVPPCVVLSSLPYDPMIHTSVWEGWTQTRNLTTFPHVCNYPSKPSSIQSFISMRFWQALDAYLSWRSWTKADTRNNARRAGRGLPPVDEFFCYYHRKYPAICFGGIGPFGNYSIPPNVTCIGSLDVAEVSKDSSTTSNKGIDDSLLEWLEDSFGEDVIYVGFGTGTVLSERQAKAFTGDLLTGLKDWAGPAHPRILWALRAAEIDRLESAITQSVGEQPTFRSDTRLEYGKKLRIEANLPQLSLLKSPHVRLFISHMGMGGFVEGVAAEVPFLCYPSGLDQYHNTQKAVEAGIAERVTSLDNVTEQVKRIWDNVDIQDNSRLAANALLNTKGEERTSLTIDGLIQRYRQEKIPEETKYVSNIPMKKANVDCQQKQPPSKPLSAIDQTTSGLPMAPAGQRRSLVSRAA